MLLFAFYLDFTQAQAECITYTFTQILNEALRIQRNSFVEKASLVRLSPVYSLYQITVKTSTFLLLNILLCHNK